MNPRWRRHRLRQTPAEMNITAFMNLMVILVPFLLITAVFSRLSILELDLPKPSTEQQQEDLRQQLTITVRAGAIQVSDRDGPIKDIPRIGSSYNLPALTDLLTKIKDRVPGETSATILLEPQVSYDIVIQVMDAVRVATPELTGDSEARELFPAISLGDAPRQLEAPGS